MIAGYFHEGSGLGNQLFRYVMTRVTALDKGYDWGMYGSENFKGTFFRDFDYGSLVKDISHTFIEERINTPQGVDIRGFDKRILAIQDSTVIDGEFQHEKYFIHHLKEIDSWLQVDPIEFRIPFVDKEDLCVINFRGGEYVGVPDLFLPKSYWENAIERMRSINPKMKFGVVTDDVETARTFFPGAFIKHDIGKDWAMIRYARYLILSNSSFAVLPALLNQEVKHIIAPFGWARYNVTDGYFATEQNRYSKFCYLDRQNEIHNFKI